MTSVVTESETHCIKRCTLCQADMAALANDITAAEEQLARVTAERDAARKWSAAWKASAQLHRQSVPHWQAQLTSATEFIAEQGAARNALSAQLEAVTAALGPLLRAAEGVDLAVTEMVDSGTAWPDSLHKGAFIDLIGGIEEAKTILAAGQTAPAADPVDKSHS